MNDRRTKSQSADAIAHGVKNRMRFLMLAGMLAVALVFGASFYFALLSNQSALARQFPELEEVAAKLRSILVLNTAVFAAIIIASFALLASMVTSRLFQPLAALHLDFAAIADGKLPRRTEASGHGAFSLLEETWSAALGRIHDRESAEIKDLTDCIGSLPRTGAPAETARKLQEMLDRKRALFGSAPRENASEREAAKDPLFIQPV